MVWGATGANTDPLGAFPREEIPDGKGTGDDVKQFHPNPSRKTRADPGGNVNNINVEKMPGLFRNVPAPSRKAKTDSVLNHCPVGTAKDSYIATPRKGSEAAHNRNSKAGTLGYAGNVFNEV